MDKFTADLILASGTRSLSSQALRVYLVLRAAISTSSTVTSRSYKKSGELVSGLSLQSIADASTEPVETVKRVLSDLVKRGWIKIKHEGKTDKLYHLGQCPDAEVLWFVDGDPSEEKELTTADKIRALAKEGAERRAKTSRVKLSNDTKRKLGREILGGIETGVDAGKKNRRKLMDLFKSRYRKAYSEDDDVLSSGPWGTPAPQANSYMKRFYDWTGSYEKAERIINFVFDNWQEIHAVIGGGDRPSLNILGTKVLCGKLQMFESSGIPAPKKKETTAKRFDKKSSEEDPDVGW